MAAPVFYGAQGVGQLFGAAATVIGANASVAAAQANEAYAKRSAQFDIFRGKLQQEAIDLQAREILAGQKASYASQNIDLSSETVSQVREETYKTAAQAKNDVELQAALDAWGKTEQAKINTRAARDAQGAARIGAGGQVIGAVGSLAVAGAML
jgi:hypothetical protein